MGVTRCVTIAGMVTGSLMTDALEGPRWGYGYGGGWGATGWNQFGYTPDVIVNNTTIQACNNSNVIHCSQWFP